MSTPAAYWSRVVSPLGLGLVLLGLIFSNEITAAVQTWIASTAYNHCFLIVPIVSFLLWDRRYELAGIGAEPSRWAAMLGLPVAVMWLAAERLGIMEGRQFAAMSFVEVLLLAVLGPRLWWAASGPLLYLYFLVPFGEFLTPSLQDATTFFIRHGLEILGIPAYIDGYVIEIPQGTFFVAEACAGLRFLIASLAFGCLYTLVMYRSSGRRAVFIMMSIVVPIVANGIRATGIVALGYLLGSAQAAAVDHILYGWIFFSVVMMILTAIGLPFRQYGTITDIGPSSRQKRPSRPFVAAVVVASLAACSPIAIDCLAMSRGQTLAASNKIEVGPDCTIEPSPPFTSSKTPRRNQRVFCSDVAMDMTWETFSPTDTAAPVMAEFRQLSRRADTEGFMQSWLPGAAATPRAWQIMQSINPPYSVAVAAWIGGKPVRPGWAMRVSMALGSLVGSTHAPTLMAVTPAVQWDTLQPHEQAVAQANLLSFLQMHPDLDARVGAMSRRP